MGKIKNTLVALAIAGTAPLFGGSGVDKDRFYHEELKYKGYTTREGDGNVEVIFENSDGKELGFNCRDSNFNLDKEYAYAQVNLAARYDVTGYISWFNGPVAINIVESKTPSK